MQLSLFRIPFVPAVALSGSLAAATAVAAKPDGAAAAAAQTWPAFVLVAGLLAIGALAAGDGLFEAAGGHAARLRGGGATLLAALLLLDAGVTAILNLDTAVVFLTPIFLHAARRRGLDERPFLYGAVLMANAASLLLPGSNLTNLIVLSREHVTGRLYAQRMLPSWLASIAAVIVVLLVVFRRALADGRRDDERPPAVPLGPGAVGIGAAAVLVLLLSEPALPVLAVAVALAAYARLPARTLSARVSPALLVGVFGLAVALGTLGRALSALGDLTATAGSWPTAFLGAGAAVLVDNLPAAALLSAHGPAHPRALLIGLDLGPNLAVTGSLSAVLWLEVARASGARPSLLAYSLLGLAASALGIVGALTALSA
jgi:arsenical pump membrane protein